MKTIIAAIASLCLVGCASTSFSPVAMYRDQLKDTREVEKVANDMKWADASDVTVLSDPDNLPEGLSINANGTLMVDKNSNFEITGYVTTRSNGRFGGFSVPFYFYPYNEDESGHKVFCDVQTPLMWVTIGLWYLVPLHYPCGTVDTNHEDDIENRKIRLINTLKKGAKAMGAKYLYFSKSVPFVYTETMGVGTRVGNMAVFSAETVQRGYEWAQAYGVALKKK